MKILATLPGPVLVHVGVLEMLFTILLCYVLAVVNGHVPIWLPMISDCAVNAPEKYPFRLGIVIGASLLALQAVATYYVNQSSKLSKPMAVMAIIASSGLAVVGVVNEDEDDAVHDFSALLFFVGYDLYALLTLHVAWNNDKVTRLSFVIKFITAIISNISTIGYVIFMYYLDMDGSIFTAMLEWTNTFALMAFLWSAVLDNIRDVNISEIDMQQSHVKTKKEIEML